jgi:hypothetical protein
MRWSFCALCSVAIYAAVVLMPVSVHSQQPRLGPRLELECDPLDPAVAALLPETRLRCGAVLQAYDRGELQDQVSTLAVDRNGAVRGLIARDEPVQALLIPGTIAHFGDEEDTIYWGLWMPGPMRQFAGTAERNSYNATVAQPYVGGVSASEYFRHDALSSGGATSSSAVPTQGTVSYELLGSPFIASRDEANARSNLIDPGPIQRASVQVDFARGTAVATVRYSVRGVGTETRFELVRRKPPSLTFESASCSDLCSNAELRFYGRQGAFAGLLFDINYNTAMSESQRVPARLNNAKGFGAVALERR